MRNVDLVYVGVDSIRLYMLRYYSINCSLNRAAVLENSLKSVLFYETKVTIHTRTSSWIHSIHLAPLLRKNIRFLEEGGGGTVTRSASRPNTKLDHLFACFLDICKV